MIKDLGKPILSSSRSCDVVKTSNTNHLNFQEVSDEVEKIQFKSVELCGSGGLDGEVIQTLIHR